MGASAALKAVFAEIAEQVQLLDGIVRNRFGDDAELLAAASARNVVGPFKSRDQETPSAGGSQTLKAA